MNKYRAKPCVIDGMRFASQKEGKRYRELTIMENAGLIADLKMQPRIVCQANGVKICTYVADFVYWCRERKRMIHEDAKGFKTPVYKLKKKIVLALTGIEIVEV